MLFWYLCSQLGKYKHKWGEVVVVEALFKQKKQFLKNNNKIFVIIKYWDN